jgi:predicted RNA-binding Zn-ribbon protein involved in translation (DUF1610 family)
MSTRRRRRRRFPSRCRSCGLIRLPEETFVRGLCPACLEAERHDGRRATGARILAKAKDAGTVERDGQTFTVSVLPPKRRSH